MKLRRSSSSTVNPTSLTAATVVVVVASLMSSSCHCSPTVERKQTKTDDGSLLSSVIDEFEDGLKKLKEYSNAHPGTSSSDSAAEEESLLTNLEKVSREDIPYPEIIPGLDRFEKELDDDFSDPESLDETPAKPVSQDGRRSSSTNDISLQELVDFVRESISQKRKGSSQHAPVFESRLTTRTPPEEVKTSTEHQKERKTIEPPVKKNLETEQQLMSSYDSAKDISLKDLLDYLREKKSQQIKDGGRSRSSSSSSSSSSSRESTVEEVVKKEIEKKSSENLKDISSAVNSNDDVSLKDALEFLSTLKKQINENKSRQMSSPK